MTTFESLLPQYESLLAENQALRKYIENVEEILRSAQIKRFGPKSEALPSEEQLLFDEIESLAKKFPGDDESDQLDLIEVSSHTKKRPKRKALPKDLPREVVVIELPLAERLCPQDGTEMKVIGKEVSERLDVIPMQMKVIETHRLTYACACCEQNLKTAPRTLEIVPKGIPTAGTLAFIATSKFCDGLSLYHISKIFERSGAEISRGSMAHWMIRGYKAAVPILNLLEEELLGRTYLQMDETPVQVLKEPGKKAQTQSYMWIRSSPEPGRRVVLFDYDPTRAGKVAEKLLETFQGRLQCDGFSGYDRLEGNPQIIRHGCMAHARRKFFEAVKASGKTSVAKHALKLIQKLYRIEDDIRGRGPEEIFAIRKEKSAPLLAELKSWCDQHLHRLPPKSLTGKALLYLTNEWPHLSRYVEDGRVHIDNNFIENCIRPFAIGRNRWLFCDTIDGAHASAGIYSLVETAKANGLDPYKYLRVLFEKLPKAQTLMDFEDLLPWIVKI